jgi:hypothetical protein
MYSIYTPRGKRNRKKREIKSTLKRCINIDIEKRIKDAAQTSETKRKEEAERICNILSPIRITCICTYEHFWREDDLRDDSIEQ